jgi:hypothetical protein
VNVDKMAVSGLKVPRSECHVAKFDAVDDCGFGTLRLLIAVGV